MGRIESVIFDWGGVLIDDPRPGLLRFCADAFGVSLERYTLVHDSFLDQFQKGLISEEAFYRKISRKLGKPAPAVPSLWSRAFRAVYVPRREVFALASSLHGKGYRTALLSNTEVDAAEFFVELNYDMFDVLVFSCMEAAAKPERRIYEITLERLDSKAGQSVFIDDRPDYVQGARDAGLDAILFKSLEQITNELAGLGVE
ncbi:MAG: HAD family phosphatase [Planctomycetota bacterium]